MKIDVYSHAIRVTDVLTDRDLQAMMAFCRPLVEYGLEKKGKRFIPKGLRTYAAATRNRKEFSFHRNQLQDLKRHLFQNQGYVERLVPITYHPTGEIKVKDVKYDVRAMYDPRERQVGIIDYVLDAENPAWDSIIKMVTLQTGGGKAVCARTPVRVPGGWKLMGQLKVGDLVVSRDGSPTTVIGVYPQGHRRLYRVTFEDGRFVDSDLEHLWHTKSFSGWRTVTTETIMGMLNRKTSVSIPLIEPEREGLRARYIGIIKCIGCTQDGNYTRPDKTAKNLAFAVRSVGGLATLRDAGDGMTTVTVVLRPASKLLAIKSIVPVQPGDAICIEVDHPERLFVVKDFIVTHNTYVAQYCMNKLSARTIIHFKGGYVQRWKDDLEKTFNFKRGEFLIVRGAKDLAALQQMALDGELHAHVIIITSGTMRDYIKNYEESNGNSKVYPIKPIDFYPALGVGFRVTDELHQEFHNNYRIDLYTHVPKSLGLSATMVSSDQFKNKVYDIAYPVRQRHDGGGYNVYISAMAVLYHMDQDVRVRYMGAQGYSHTTFEESIMRHKGLLKNYLKIIDHAIYHRYVSVREEGQKALVFFARVDMCTLMVERLRKMYPELNVVRYVGSEGDSYEELLEADVGVTTIGSGGTAIDIKNLRSSFMTTAIDSRQSNEQVLGRTRPLIDWPDVTPEFIYFGCLEIEQHCKYHKNKREVFKGKVLSHGEMISRYTLALK
ncbi:hypothetical protein D3C85_14490 [compost metagenome]